MCEKKWHEKEDEKLPSKPMVMTSETEWLDTFETKLEWEEITFFTRIYQEETPMKTNENQIFITWKKDKLGCPKSLHPIKLMLFEWNFISKVLIYPESDKIFGGDGVFLNSSVLVFIGWAITEIVEIMKNTFH